MKCLNHKEEQALEDIETGKTKMVNCSLEEILKDIDCSEENKKKKKKIKNEMF